MRTNCTSIQELLAAGGGDVSLLTADERAHVVGCAECAAALEGEQRLARLLGAALPPDDPTFEAEVMAALEPRRGQRLLALLPVAASLLLTLAGTVLLGGLPGGGLFAQVPAWSSRGWLTLAAAGHDWVIAVNAASRTAAALLPPPVMAVAAVVSLAGLAAVVGAARRWRTARHPDGE